MAELLELTTRHYQQIEYGKVNIPVLTLDALADCFGEPRAGSGTGTYMRVWSLCVWRGGRRMFWRISSANTTTAGPLTPLRWGCIWGSP